MNNNNKTNILNMKRACCDAIEIAEDCDFGSDEVERTRKKESIENEEIK